MTLSKCNWQGLKVEWGGGERSWQRLVSKQKHAPDAMSARRGAGWGGGGGSLYLVSSEPQAG